MSATVDANVLVYASDAASPSHQRAEELVRELAAGPEIFYLFWPTVMAYLRIVTHPTILRTPIAPDRATVNIERLLAPAHVRTAGETDRFWEVWRDTTRDVRPRGNLVPDAHLVALMREHGVETIWSRDRGLRRFAGIRVVDPFAS